MFLHNLYVLLCYMLIMKKKAKSIFFVIILFFIYWVGLSIMGVLPIFWGYSPIISSHVGRYVFVIPFLFFLFKKTGIGFISDESGEGENAFPILRLLSFGLLLVSVGYIYKFLFSSYPLVIVNSNATPIEIIATNISLVIMCPITEELFFRKWMISYLDKAEIKPLYILIITSLLFFIPHTDQVHWYFRYDILIFGILMYYIFKKYNNIKYCIFVHFINNLIVAIVNLVGLYM